jgi:hypothetical protein
MLTYQYVIEGCKTRILHLIVIEVGLIRRKKKC